MKSFVSLLLSFLFTVIFFLLIATLVPDKIEFKKSISIDIDQDIFNEFLVENKEFKNNFDKGLSYRSEIMAVKNDSIIEITTNAKNNDYNKSYYFITNNLKTKEVEITYRKDIYNRSFYDFFLKLFRWIKAYKQYKTDLGKIEYTLIPKLYNLKYAIKNSIDISKHIPDKYFL